MYIILQQVNINFTSVCCSKPQPDKRLPIAMSFDIQTSPTLPRRPPLRNTANMFQVMEKRLVSLQHKYMYSSGKTSSIIIIWRHGQNSPIIDLKARTYQNVQITKLKLSNAFLININLSKIPCVLFWMIAEVLTFQNWLVNTCSSVIVASLRELRIDMS